MHLIARLAASLTRKVKRLGRLYGLHHPKVSFLALVTTRAFISSLRLFPRQPCLCNILNCCNRPERNVCICLGYGPIPRDISLFRPQLRR